MIILLFVTIFVVVGLLTLLLTTDDTRVVVVGVVVAAPVIAVVVVVTAISLFPRIFLICARFSSNLFRSCSKSNILRLEIVDDDGDLRLEEVVVATTIGADNTGDDNFKSTGFENDFTFVLIDVIDDDDDDDDNNNNNKGVVKELVGGVEDLP